MICSSVAIRSFNPLYVLRFLGFSFLFLEVFKMSHNPYRPPLSQVGTKPSQVGNKPLKGYLPVSVAAGSFALFFFQSMTITFFQDSTPLVFVLYLIETLFTVFMFVAAFPRIKELLFLVAAMVLAGIMGKYLGLYILELTGFNLASVCNLANVFVPLQLIISIGFNLVLLMLGRLLILSGDNR